ncbi:MAG: hypothetical protein U0174_09430 [Polyangiaceae bacterium]
MRTHRTTPRRSWILVSAIPALLGLSACAASVSGAMEAGDAPNPSAGQAADAGSGAPEEELEANYEAPVATGKYVWTVNAKSGRLAVVDAATLGVRTVDAGSAPTFVAAVPNQEAAFVVSATTGEAFLFRVKDTGIDRARIVVAKGANSVAFSADGSRCIVWTDSRRITPAPPKTRGYQEVTVVDFASGKSQVLSVGYRPVAVGFTGTGARAYAVTQDGVSLIDVAAAPPAVTRNVATADSPLDDPGTRDVSVTPSGEYALIRRDNVNSITAVKLDSGERKSIDLGAPVTDLDLTPAGDKAVAVLRSQSKALVLPIPGIVDNPTSFASATLTGETIGSAAIAPGATLALLYTTATPVERISILSLEASPLSFRTARLYAPVSAVFASPDAKHGVVLHGKDTNAAFSLLPLASDLPAKIVALEGALGVVALGTDRGIVTETGPSNNAAHLLRFPSLMAERYPLASTPTAAGIVSTARRAYIAQEHPEGRMTFINLDDGQARTLTGFELASKVVDGSKP